MFFDAWVHTANQTRQQTFGHEFIAVLNGRVTYTHPAVTLVLAGQPLRHDIIFALAFYAITEFEVFHHAHEQAVHPAVCAVFPDLPRVVFVEMAACFIQVGMQQQLKQGINQPFRAKENIV